MIIFWSLIVIFLLQGVDATYNPTVDPRDSDGKVFKHLGLSLDGIRHGHLWQLVTFQFMHGGIIHIIFNVLTQHEPDHILLREARRDAVHTYLDLETAQAYLRKMQSLPARLKTVNRVPPLSFALFVTKIKEALLVEDPREMTERLFNLWWSRLNESNPDAADASLPKPDK